MLKIKKKRKWWIEKYKHNLHSLTVHDIASIVFTQYTKEERSNLVFKQELDDNKSNLIQEAEHEPTKRVSKLWLEH